MGQGEPAGEDQKAASRKWLLRGGVVALAVVIGLIAWLATGDDDDQSASAPVQAEARIVSEEEFVDLAATYAHPVYWAGPIADTKLELTEDPEGGVQVRYLAEDADAGEGTADFLAVGSYPLADPAGELDGFAERAGSIVQRAPDGRKVVTSEERPTSVYFVSPDNAVQVEVYDPSPQRAMGLTLSGKVEPAG